MNLSQWDRDVAPRLGRIESYSGKLVRDAQTISRNVRELVVMPDFETRAGDQLHTAKAELEAALAQVNSAIGQLSAKPVSA